MLWKVFSPKSLCSWLELSSLVKSREWSCEGAGAGAAWVLSPAPGLSERFPGRGEPLEGVQALRLCSLRSAGQGGQQPQSPLRQGEDFAREE